MSSIMDHDSVFVIGGGTSLQNFDFSKLTNKCTIAVNKAILDVPNLDYFISVDFTFLNKIDKNKVKSCPATKIFVADLSYPFLQEKEGSIVDTRFNLVYKLQDFDTIIKCRKQSGMGITLKDFRTGKNSGFCALQLAVALGFRKIYLLGIDLVSGINTHYHGGYGETKNKFNRKLDEYFNFFKAGIEELKTYPNPPEIYSCSQFSKLNRLIPFVGLSEILG